MTVNIIAVQNEENHWVLHFERLSLVQYHEILWPWAQDNLIGGISYHFGMAAAVRLYTESDIVTFKLRWHGALCE